jgi:ABC-type uncharacterized transport system substrate-binding protein
VFTTVSDPVGSGLVASLARPEGNVTGLSIQSPDIAGKRLALLREIVPNLRRVAFMGNIDNPFVGREMREVQAAASGAAGPSSLVWFELAQPVPAGCHVRA